MTEKAIRKLTDFMTEDLQVKVGRKKIWVYEHVRTELRQLATAHGLDPELLAEYFIQLGINTVKHRPKAEVKFDIEHLK